MTFYTKYATNNDCYKAAKPMSPVGILVHSTGARNKSLKRYVNYPEVCGVNVNKNYWDKPNTICVHAFLGEDKNGKVATVQILPYNYACWGCGNGKKGSYNYNPTGHIQFEICEGENTDKDYFNRIYIEAIEYCVDLCKRYKWTSKNITSHKEANILGYASAHTDPFDYFAKFGKTMDMFRAEVQKRLTSTATTSNVKDSVITEVKDNFTITSSKFIYKAVGTPQIRNSASTTAVSIGKCVKNNYYVADGLTSNDWIKHYGQKTYSSTKDNNDILLEKYREYKVMITTASLNVRTQPSVSASKATNTPLAIGTKVFVVAGVVYKGNGYTWYQIVYNNKLAWVDSQWLK